MPKRSDFSGRNGRLRAFEIIAFGDVQGVGFRRAVQREARRLGVVGQIKNRKDGAVEIIAQSEADILELFMDCIRELGLPISVQSLERKASVVSKRRKFFEIIHGNMNEELDEGLGAGEAQSSAMRQDMTRGFGGLTESVNGLRSDVNSKFDTLATRHDAIPETLTKVVEESA
jgi:acylphosphatase